MSEETNTEIIEIPQPAGKTFSEDYVKTVREEAKENRIARKAAEQEVIAIKAKFKSLIGLKDTDDLNDDALTKYQSRQAEQLTVAMQKSNARLIQAEIKSLNGYDTKLVDRLLDKSKIKIDDDGNITGLKEAVEALAVEFPQIKVAQATQGGVNPPPGNNKTELEQTQEAYTIALKAGRTAEVIALKNKIFQLSKK